MNTTPNTSNNDKWYADFFIDTLNAAISTSLTYDENASNKLELFDGKVIKIILETTPVTLFIKVNNCQVTLSKHHAGNVDTTIIGTPLALFAMNSDEPIVGIKSVEIQGDASTGQFFAKWLKNLNPDWSEAWQDLLGENLGAKVANAIGGVINFGKNLQKTVVANTSQYLVDETGDLIAAEEMEEFIEDVEDLQADTNRLKKQIQILKNS
ncbi:MAG: hypothetical protein L3J53_02690 [Proteobacteria bacterium]|nr:hypothetical protein [Pseudomonadota bacterium]